MYVCAAVTKSCSDRQWNDAWVNHFTTEKLTDLKDACIPIVKEHVQKDM